MNKLVLVRYGEHENGHLNKSGKQAMVLVGEKLKSVFQDKRVCVVCAQIPRAIESAEIISKYFNTSSVQQFTEFYVSEEIPVDLNRAIEIINSMSKECDFLVMVISREYIEALPDYILKSLGAQGKTETHLGRGEVLILDYDKKDVVYLR